MDAPWLGASEQVCRTWQKVIAQGKLWQKLIEHNVKTDIVWKGIAEKRGWFVSFNYVLHYLIGYIGYIFV